MKKVLIIFFCFVQGWICEAAESKVLLPYQPNLPVLLKSELSLNLSQSLPGLSLSTHSKQYLSAVEVLNNDSSFPITQPPFDLTFTLKSIKIDLNANDEKVTFSSNEPGSSFYLSQIGKLVDFPIQLHVGDGFAMKSDSPALLGLINELPVLKEINSVSLLSELFLHLFALGGKEIVLGQTYTQDTENIPSLPQTIEYKVTDIDYYHVKAEINGKIDKRKLQLKGLVQIGENEHTPVDVSLSGDLKGHVSWNRDNAMLYDMDVEYDYIAMCKIGEWEWMMKVALKCRNKTTLP